MVHEGGSSNDGAKQRPNMRGNLLRIGRESIEALVKGIRGLGQTRKIHCT